MKSKKEQFELASNPEIPLHLRFVEIQESDDIKGLEHSPKIICVENKRLQGRMYEVVRFYKVISQF